MLTVGTNTASPPRLPSPQESSHRTHQTPDRHAPLPTRDVIRAVKPLGRPDLRQRSVTPLSVCPSVCPASCLARDTDAIVIRPRTQRRAAGFISHLSGTRWRSVDLVRQRVGAVPAGVTKMLTGQGGRLPGGGAVWRDAASAGGERLPGGRVTGCCGRYASRTDA